MERLLATANELIGRAFFAFDFFNLETSNNCVFSGRAGTGHSGDVIG